MWTLCINVLFLWDWGKTLEISAFAVKQKENKEKWKRKILTFALKTKQNSFLRKGNCFLAELAMECCLYLSWIHGCKSGSYSTQSTFTWLTVLLLWGAIRDTNFSPLGYTFCIPSTSILSQDTWCTLCAVFLGHTKQLCRIAPLYLGMEHHSLWLLEGCSWDARPGNVLCCDVRLTIAKRKNGFWLCLSEGVQWGDVFEPTDVSAGSQWDGEQSQTNFLWTALLLARGIRAVPGPLHGIFTQQR